MGRVLTLGIVEQCGELTDKEIISRSLSPIELHSHHGVCVLVRGTLSLPVQRQTPEGTSELRCIHEQVEPPRLLPNKAIRL